VLEVSSERRWRPDRGGVPHGEDRGRHTRGYPRGHRYQGGEKYQL